MYFISYWKEVVKEKVQLSKFNYLFPIPAF